MQSLNKYILVTVGASLSLFAWLSVAKSGNSYLPFIQKIVPADTIPKETKKSRRPTYQEKDRHGDAFNNKASESPLLLHDPANVSQEVELDSSGQNYIVDEKMGDLDYRPPTTMSFEEYSRYQQKKMIRNYWQNKGADSSGLRDRKDPKAGPLSLKIKAPGLAGPFGGDYVDIKPNGLVTLDFAYKHQRVFNPQIPVSQQSQGTFDFDNQIQMNVVGKIGTKLKLSINWDTKATFEFQNNFKIEYTGGEEDILQKIEVGQVSMPINSSLISGAQNLFGVKAKMQFGRMSVVGVYASQRGASQQITAQGGSSIRTVEIKADAYDDYRHFFLGHFFRDKYEKALESTPNINSGVIIPAGRIEVYITNSNNTTTDLRNVVAYLDLGEAGPYRAEHKSELYSTANPTPLSNTANLLWNTVSDTNSKQYRNPTILATSLAAPPLNLIKGTDYEILNNARKLKPEEFTFNPSLGYISLVSPLRPYEILAVSYQYAYNGTSYKVGELKEDYSSRDSNDVIILKLLKPSNIMTRLPTWDLMMKNIYQLGAAGISRDNFQLRMIYKDDISGADIPNLQEGAQTKSVPLVKLFGLDRLNPNNDPFPDGNFDYIEGVTIDSKNGRIIFPVLEPLTFTKPGTPRDPTVLSKGRGNYFSGEADLYNKYVYVELYDSTKSDASQVASKNKFFLRGQYQSTAANEIPLTGAINLAPGSVKITAGSRQLVEGVDYTVDYNQGKVKILNEGVLASGQNLVINYEKQDLFNVRQKSFYGTRLDYKVNKDINIGGTFLHQSERPTITRVNVGDEPSSNSIWGVDGNIKKESRILTKLVDLLPIIQTKAPSSITSQVEFAQFIPGHNSALNNNGSNGAAFIDDFEASETPYDFVRTPTKWRISSTPLRFGDSGSDSLRYSYHKALISTYNVDPLFYSSGVSSRPVNSNVPAPEKLGHFERGVTAQEIFPYQNQQVVTTNLPMLDLAYFPSERGPYNYNPGITKDNSGITPKEIIPGLPQNNWAGVTRNIGSDIDFDNANIQYIEFWMMSPYIKATDPNNTLIDGKPFVPTNKGKLYFNLGNISEDVLKDGLQSAENALSVNGSNTSIKQTKWGKVTTTQPLTTTFDNNPDNRSKQDVGLDGLSNADEKTFPFAPASPVLGYDDPSGDDFSYYLSDQNDQKNLSISSRYKRYNGLENNSPVTNPTDASKPVPSSGTQPDNEDINLDNTLSTIDEYYEYSVDIDPAQLVTGKNYIVSKTDSKWQGDDVTWLQFRVPIRKPTSTFGSISGFKSIRFMRMYVTGFTDPVILRFAQLQLVSNQWRVYQFDDINQNGFGAVNEPDDAQLVVSTVNIEENGASIGANSIPYVLPPGTIRDQDATSTIQRSINEQSLKLSVTNLGDGHARAVYKNTTFNLINYKQVNMYLHADNLIDAATTDGQMTAFVRLGTDFTQNYYEIEVPLYFTPKGSTDANSIWDSRNAINIQINDLVNTKLERNSVTNNNLKASFSRILDGKILSVMGNPDLSAVTTIMIGLRNPLQNPLSGADIDHSPKSANIWVDELRVTQFVEQSSWAAAAKINAQLADLGSVTGSLRYTTAGFGGLDQKVSQRANNNTLQYGTSANLMLDKFIPHKWGIKLPMYISFDRTIIAPKYNPLNPDVLLTTYLDSIHNATERDNYKKLVEDISTSKAINFTNFKKVKTKKGAKVHFYDIENLSFTVGYNETKRTSFEIKDYSFQSYKGALEYNYNKPGKSLEPFKNVKFLKNKNFKAVKDFNVALIPTSFTFRNDILRNLTKTQYYQSGPLTPGQDPLYQKIFTLNRTYGMLWNLTKSINLDYMASALAIVDEPNRAPGDQAYSDSMWNNFKSFGRLKNFNQSVNATYKLPLDKIPFTNWLNADVKYTGGYNWISGAIAPANSVSLRDTLGNLLSNKRDMALNGKVNFELIYNRVKFLKEINSTPLNSPPPVKNPKDTSQTRKPPDLKAIKAALKFVMLIKSVNFTYGVTNTTQLPGYLPIPTYFGVDTKAQSGAFNYNGNTYNNINQLGNLTDILPFILGSQDPNFRHRAAELGWMSKSRYMNTPYIQTSTINLSLRTTIEPIRDFKIQLDLKKTIGSNYQELFRVDSLSAAGHNALDPNFNPTYSSDNPTRSGNYSISYISLLTAFDQGGNASFDKFQQYRNIIRSRLGNTGYLQNSQDVLIPAFIAAYTGKDAHTQSLTSFPSIPLPNWTITYTGLTKIKAIQRLFPSVTINHAYSSTYGVGSFASSLVYNSNYINPNNSFETYTHADSVNKSGAYIPLYVIDVVNIRESFSPLVGFNIKTKGKVSYKLEYGRTRSLALSMSNAQIREDVSNNFTFGIGYTKAGVKLPKFQGRSVVLKNELTFRLDLTVRDAVSYQRKLDEGTTITSGNTNFQIKPTLSYNVSQRVTMMFYVEHTRNIPKISSSFQRNTTTIGLQIRFTLS